MYINNISENSGRGYRIMNGIKLVWFINSRQIELVKLKTPVHIYPPKGTAKAVYERVHLTVFHFNMCLTNKIGVSKSGFSMGLFEILKTFIVRMGGWVDGDQKCPSIFLIFKYVNK